MGRIILIMSKLEEIILGTKALDYIIECLDSGLTLSGLLLKNVNEEKGIITTQKPAFINKSYTIDDYNYGITYGKEEYFTQIGIEVPKGDLNLYARESIKSFLEKSDRNICVVQDFNAKPKDSYLSRMESRIFTYKNEVYYLLSKEDIAGEIIENTLKFAKSIPFYIGAMISLPENKVSSFKDERQLIPEDFELFTRNVKKIFAGAYDGEGYLIWHKQDKV